MQFMDSRLFPGALGFEALAEKVANVRKCQKCNLLTRSLVTGYYTA